ncbi:DUF6801 domain-containing protein [Actinomadura gamaensis]|uniref:DUF6801 domain-containing protein n=1 Tax=Actinomadura gamaensis TaxID=1763541 RepID=A0ABV9U7V7_9ACTN
MRSNPRTLARNAAVTTVIVSAGVLGVGGEASADMGARVTYLCSTPDATYKVVAGFSATMPTVAKAGQAVRLGDVSVTLEVPGTLRAALTRSPGSRADDPLSGGTTGAVRFATTMSEHGQTVDAAWPTFSLASSGAAAGGGRPVVLRGSAAVPGLVTDGAGTVVWKADSMYLKLAAGNAASGPAPLTCTATSGTTLGQIRVGVGAPASRSPRSSRPPTSPDSSTARAAGTGCSEEPVGDINRDPRLAPPSTPDGINLTPLRVLRPGTPECAKASGFGTLGKLGAAIPVGAQARLRLNVGAQIDLQNNFRRSYTYGHTDPSPATGTALGFGFMPTRATVLTSQVAPPGGTSDVANIYSDFPKDESLPSPWDTWGYIRSFVQLKVSGIAVNGVDVNVGDRCQTDPLPLDLKNNFGNDQVGRSSLQFGGTYTGKINIPGFRGCGAGEDLTPIIDATSSGPDNSLRLESSVWCNPLPGEVHSCVDEGEREPRTFTVNPGGSVVATMKPFVMAGDLNNPDTGKIQCESASWKISFKRGHYLSMYRIASITGARFNKCVRYPDNVPTTLKASALPWSMDAPADNSTPDVYLMRLAGVYLTASGTDGCRLYFNKTGFDGSDMPGILSDYALDAKHDTLTTDLTSALTVSTKSQCDSSNSDYSAGAAWRLAGTFSYKPHQRITTP